MFVFEPVDLVGEAFGCVAFLNRATGLEDDVAVVIPFIYIMSILQMILLVVIAAVTIYYSYLIFAQPTINHYIMRN